VRSKHNLLPLFPHIPTLCRVRSNRFNSFCFALW